LSQNLCPVCGKDLSSLSKQAAYGHIGGHKRKKAANQPGSSQPSPAGTPKKAQKATFSADVKPQEDLESYKKPKEEVPKAQQADGGEVIEGLITLAFDRWNDYVTSEATTVGGPPKIAPNEVKALAVSVRQVLEKHGGTEGLEGVSEYLPEISLLIAAGLIGMKMYAGMRYRAGKRGGVTTFGKAALAAESPDQSTAKGYEIFNDPTVKAEIDRAFKVAQGGGE
jgi:hypothetical protein